MTYTIDESLENFRAWSGGKDTLNVLIDKGVCDKVEEFIEECFSNPTDTDINDFLWFERDQIAEHLGYDSWEDFENGKEIYKDINGVKLEVGDEVYWDDEAGYDDDGNPIIFTIVEEDGTGYFNLSYGDEDETPSRWAYYKELDLIV